MNRSAAILLHISSLASPYGIGTMGEAALRFVDFLADSNIKYWQVLPLNPVGFANSPYQSESVFAGNPLLIDLDLLIEDNLLTKEQVKKHCKEGDLQVVDYNSVSEQREKLLRLAFKKAGDEMLENSKVFCNNNSWLYEYALYKTIKHKHNGVSFDKWEADFKRYDPHKIESLMDEALRKEYDYHVFIQFIFFLQFARLRSYATERSVCFIGDLPIYPSFDSADVWANQELFDLNQDSTPRNISGVPPDMFSADGQLWGNPLYSWAELKKNDYAWWKLRVSESLKLFDLIRIDHFRAFDSFWEVPSDSKTAKNGRWVKGPGMDLFNSLKKDMGALPVIAEDLGILTDSVRTLLKDSGFPGMKVLQFAFTPYHESDYLPHNIIKNSVVYTGTHDNNTVKGWMDGESFLTRGYIAKYLNAKELTVWDVISSAWSSCAVLAVTTMQDVLELSGTARMNMPGTVSEKNWSWRMLPEQLTNELSVRLKEITELYFRN